MSVSPLFSLRLTARLAALLLLAAPLAAQPAAEAPAAQEAPAARDGGAPAQPEAAEIPLDFRKLEAAGGGAGADSLESVAKPSSRLPDGMGPKERSRPNREEPPLPPEPQADEAPSGDGSGNLESLPTESKRGGGRGNRDSDRRHRPDYDLYEEASRAAAWAAEWQVRRYGLPEYYRVGAWQGLRDAFERVSRRSYAFDRGEDAGERDPRARRSGAEQGEKAALARAEAAALADVENEFRDLDHEPRRNPRPEVEPLPENFIRVRQPRLEETFGEMPIGSYLSYENFDRYTDAWQLYRCTSWGEVYDSDWENDKRAFEHWRERGNSSLWDRLSRPEQDYFRRTFVKELDYWRARELRRHADDAYREGYDDGWDYGSKVAAEMRFREGYQQGFLAAATAAAERAWDEVYPEVYSRVYREEFETWMSSARPEITRAELFYDNDDGIFEPGEEVRLALELANYGGREVRLELGADGPAIEPASSPRPISLRRRDRATGELWVKIDPHLAPRTNSSFSVRAGNVGKTVTVLVSRPLELDGRVVFSRVSSIEGRASLEATVYNRSRKPAAGSLDVVVAGRRWPGRSLEVLAPQSRRQVNLELEQLDPLDLLEGETEVRLELRSHDVVQDQLRQRLPALGLDLASPELVDFWMAAVYGELRLDRGEADRAIELIRRRLAADWEKQRAASGNPYKEDLQQGGRRTALGELVAAVTSQRRPPHRPELERALAARVRSLAEELPGTHPFLRGSFKKLAARLD